MKNKSGQLKSTPETDALFIKHGYPVEVDTHKAMLLCEKLEQERDEAREEIRDWKRLHDAAERGVDLTIAEGTISDLLKQRDEAREERDIARLEFEEISNDLTDARKERDKAREELKEIAEYGTEEINAAVELRQKLAAALIERDEARDELARIHLLLLDPHAVFLNFLHGKIAKLDWDKLEHIHGPHPAVVERDEARQDAKHWEELYRTISTY